MHLIHKIDIYLKLKNSYYKRIGIVRIARLGAVIVVVVQSRVETPQYVILKQKVFGIAIVLI